MVVWTEVAAGAGGGGGGSSSPIIYIAIAIVVVAFVVSLFRLRRGGPGPAVNYVPRSLRPRLSSLYRRRGWQAPYDEEGERNPNRDAL